MFFVNAFTDFLLRFDNSDFFALDCPDNEREPDGSVKPYSHLAEHGR
jgi:hypothetical protein